MRSAHWEYFDLIDQALESLAEEYASGRGLSLQWQGGKVQLSGVKFTSNDHLRRIIERIVTPLGRRIDEKTPYVDARLKDGSRVNAVLSPVARKGIYVSIRKFMSDALSMKQLVQFGRASLW